MGKLVGILQYTTVIVVVVVAATAYKNLIPITVIIIHTIIYLSDLGGEVLLGMRNCLTRLQMANGIIELLETQGFVIPSPKYSATCFQCFQ